MNTFSEDIYSRITYSSIRNVVDRFSFEPVEGGQNRLVSPYIYPIKFTQPRPNNKNKVPPRINAVFKVAIAYAANKSLIGRRNYVITGRMKVIEWFS